MRPALHELTVAMRQITIPENSRRTSLARSVPRHTLRTTTLSSSATMSSIVTWMSGNFWYALPTYCLAPCGPGGIPEGAVVDKFGREIHNGDVEVLLVDELVKMIAYIRSSFRNESSASWDSRPSASVGDAFRSTVKAPASTKSATTVVAPEGALAASSLRTVQRSCRCSSMQ
jgi:hypothetical protein